MYIKSETHGPEYSFHKYWSRKPANVIRHHLSEHLPPAGTVVDPFSGSGVTTREATLLGMKSFAFDVNPIAVEISSFMTSISDHNLFRERADEIISNAEEELGYLYRIGDGVVRFFVHNMVTKCKSCQLEAKFDKDIYGVNGKSCLGCSRKLSFGLTSMERTEISEIHFLGGKVLEEGPELSEQQGVSNSQDSSSQRFSDPLVDNKRTLTSSAFTTSSYFTPRNHRILSRVAELCHEESDPQLKRALLLLVTGTSAQASRLIASRGKLAGGGQAWTIPGFWVPPVHLESNPFVHLRARVKKVAAAIKAIADNQGGKGASVVSLKSGAEGMRELIKAGVKADLVFLDPPYGDSVAFTEFSSIWNSFLESNPVYGQDLSVSDRLQDPMTMTSYSDSLKEISLVSHEILNESGKILLTFNNHDLDAWTAISHAIQAAGFRTLTVRYQDPAVVSSKAQMSKEGSYVGDFYVTFEKSERPLRSFEDVEPQIRVLLTNAANCRGGEVSKGLALRFALEMCLREDVDATSIGGLVGVIESLFKTVGKKLLLPNPDPSSPNLSKLVNDAASGQELLNASSIKAFAGRLQEQLLYWGAPSVDEALAILGREPQLFLIE
jgi:adenine-specific DNA methylase